jgi:hypothetical protein
MTGPNGLCLFSTLLFLFLSFELFPRMNGKTEPKSSPSVWNKFGVLKNKIQNRTRPMTIDAVGTLVVKLEFDNLLPI